MKKQSSSALFSFLKNGIETRRLIVRRALMTDVDSIFERVTSSADVARFLTWTPHKSRTETLRFLEKSVQNWNERLAATLVICRRADDLPIGTIGVRPRLPEVVIGLSLSVEVWALGYASESMRALIDSLLRVDGVFRVCAFADPMNFRSVRMLNRCGMIYEATLRQYSVLPNLSGEPRDSQVYSCVKGNSAEQALRAAFLHLSASEER
jgi:ribosomal-protein-alanine N-acetyltransferase